MAYYKDLYEHIHSLERDGLLVRVTRPINKDTEMHSLVRWQFRGLNEDQRRAFYFEDVYDSKGNNYTIPVLVGGLAASQKIYALGLMCNEDQVEQVWSNALDRPVEPIIVEGGPVKEVIHKGSNLMDHGGLTELPVPISTPGFDNAPYLTAGCWVTKDPETGVRNVGIYRAQIKGALKTSVFWGTLKDSTVHWEKCNKLGVPLEAAIIIGGPPCITYAAVQTVPYGVDEISIAGGLARAPIELVRCETVDLEVPAHADIVIEGRILSDALEPDGPFGEAHGYMDPGDLAGIFEVTCITHKAKPVFVSMISQLTPSESSKMKQSANETFAFKQLQNVVGDSVIRVVLHEDLLNRQMAVIKINRRNSDDPWRAMEALLPSRLLHKMIVCVDPDIDARDPASIAWAISNRSQPHKDVRIVPNRPLPWNPIRYVADGKRYDVTDSSLLIDATLKAEFPPVALPRKDYMDKARAIWQELRLPELSPRSPYFGYSLGYWPDEAKFQADNATSGDYVTNAELCHSGAIKVPKGVRLMEIKKKFLAERLGNLKKRIPRS